MKRLIVFFAVMVCPVMLLADAGSDHQVDQTRPIELGTSGGNILDRSMLYCCSGTLGSLVQDALGNLYALSNNHVLARVNVATPGEEINQPGQIDQKCDQVGVVADLSDFVVIKFKKGRGGGGAANEVDAAIAQVRADQVRSDGSILDIGTVSANTVAAFVGQTVQKSGRTTGLTFGMVSAVDVTVDVGYSAECGGPLNQTARFVNQIRIGPGGFSAGGDSGSLVVEEGAVDSNDGRPRAVGLLFAGSSNSTLINPIDSVLTLLGVSMVGGGPTEPIPTGRVFGIVTDTLNNPIEGATVSVDTGQSSMTVADGSYVIADVPEGERLVTASAVGFESKTTAATVVENQDTVVDFALMEASVGTQSIVDCVIYNTEGGKNGDKHLLITIRVVDNLGAAVSGAQVDIAVTLDGSPFGTGSGATTNGSGEVTYSAKNTPSGTYETMVTAVVATDLSFEGTTPPNGFVKGSDPVPACFCQAGSTCSGTSDVPVSARGSIGLDVRQVKARHSDALFSIPGVVGHGVGLSDAGETVIEVYLVSESASSRAQISEVLESVPVRVVVTGRFEAF